MDLAKRILVGFAVCSLIIAGCKDAATDTGKKTEKKKDDHGGHGAGPNGGVIIEFGAVHGEFAVDHAKKEATIYIWNEEIDKAEPIAAAEMKLSIKSPKFQVDLKPSPKEGDPKGKSSRFVAVHDNFGKEQEFEGTLSGVIDGKPYAGDFKEEPHKDEKKK